MAFYNCVKLEYHDFIQYRIYKKPIEKDYEKCIYDGVGVYNTKIATLPTNIIAGIFSFKEEVLFEAEKEARKNIDVNL